MRDSLTLFVAVVLCLLLCLPAKSLNKLWHNSISSRSVEPYTDDYLSSILSITFKAENTSNFGSELGELYLIPKNKPHQYTLDWSAFLDSKPIIKIYNATGDLLNENTLQIVENQLGKQHDHLKLAPGIYYAFIAFNAGQSTQKGYAKFVVK